MNCWFAILIQLLIIQHLLGFCLSNYYYEYLDFILEWPGSSCNIGIGCCYPTTGKPKPDFIIHGLQPANRNKKNPRKCDPPNRPFKEDKISDLENRMNEDWPSLSCPSGNSNPLWLHNWKTYGTCTQSIFNEHSYFKAALVWKHNVKLLQILVHNGVEPNGGSYSLENIKSIIISNISRHAPEMICNSDKYGNRQLHKIRFCLDREAHVFIECPSRRLASCRPTIRFPSF